MAELTERRGSLTAHAFRRLEAAAGARLRDPARSADPVSGRADLRRGSRSRARTFWDLIDELSATGHTVFVSTHYMDEAEYCNRLALMYAGKVIALGAPAELKKAMTEHSLLRLDTSGSARDHAGARSTRTGILEVAVFGSGLHVAVDDVEAAQARIRAALARTRASRSRRLERDRAFDGRRLRGADRSRGKEGGGMNYRRTRAVFVKELRHIMRDKRSLGLALAMPAMMLLLFGFALSLDVDHFPR